MSRVVVYVTGASGFVGSHVARELRERGYEVRTGWVDLLDAKRLRRAFAGCDAVVHVAALYSFTAPAAELEAVNVGGTRNVVEACRAEGVRRLLATSSSATCGPVPGRQATEDDSPPPWELAVPYKRTKLEAERLVLAAGGVCVNPTTPVGDGDRTPTPTGAMIRGVASGRYRAYPRIGLNVVDVRDVARGHVLAFERGRAGERYILNAQNMTVAAFFQRLSRVSGVAAPVLRMPSSRPLAVGLGKLFTRAVRAIGGEPPVDEVSIEMGQYFWYCDGGKAERDLGFSPRDPGETLRDTVNDLVARKVVFPKSASRVSVAQRHGE